MRWSSNAEHVGGEILHGAVGAQRQVRLRRDFVERLPARTLARHTAQARVRSAALDEEQRSGGVEPGGERVAVRAAPEARVDDGPAARRDLAGGPAAELGRGEGVEVGAARRPRGREVGEQRADAIGAQMREPRDRGQHLGQARLPAARDAAHDDHQWQPCLPGKALGERQEVACVRAVMTVGRALGRPLGCPQQRHLRSHQRTMRRAEGDQRVVARVSAAVAVTAYERPRVALTSARDQIHDQRREVVGNVDLAQCAVGGHAVDQLHLAVEQHVLGAQVAMPLPYPAASRADVQRPRVRHDECVREALQGEHTLDLGPLLDDRQHLMEARGHPPLDGQRRHPHRRCTARARVKPCQRAPHRVHLVAPELAALQPPRQRAALVVPAHLHHVVDRARVLLGRQLHAARRRHHRTHAEIHLRGRAAVEPHLLVAQCSPALGRVLFRDRWNRRLEELVGAIARQKGP